MLRHADFIRPHQQRAGLLDFAHPLPLAVQVLRFGRARHDDPQERKIEATYRVLPCSAGETGHDGEETLSGHVQSVDMRVPPGPTSQACEILAPGLVVGWL